MKKNLSRPLLFSLLSIVAYATTPHEWRACVSSLFAILFLSFFFFPQVPNSFHMLKEIRFYETGK